MKTKTLHRAESDGYILTVSQHASGEWGAQVRDAEKIYISPDGAVTAYCPTAEEAKSKAEDVARSLAAIPNLPFVWQEEQVPLT